MGPSRRTRGWIWPAAAIGGAGLALLCGVGFFWISAPHSGLAPADVTLLAQPGDAERGRLVFAAGDCASCHASPGQPDRTRLGGGFALASPFGTLRVPNISPDPHDGIGRWRAVDLANALLNGVSPDGRHYYPAFPYTSFTRMKIEDVRDLWAYLQTLPPVQNRPPPHELPLPFRFRRLVGFWKLLFFDRTPLPPEPQRDPVWHRGRYLVEAEAHCVECHSSRNLLGGIKPDTRFAGGPDPEGTGFIPNITPAQIGDWSEDDIVALLTTGRTPSGKRVGSSMADVVTNTAMLPESDRRAIAVFIKSLPARPTLKP